MSDPAVATTRHQRIMIGLLAVIAAVAAAWLLRQLFLVLMPLAAAFFLMLLVRPLQRGVARRLLWKLKWLSLVAAMGSFFVVGAAAIGAMVLAFNRITEALPKYRERATAQIEQITQWMHEHDLQIPVSGQGAMSGGDRIYGMVTAGLTSTTTVLGVLVLIFFLVLLLLLDADDWQRKCERILSPQRRDTVLNTLNAIATKIRRYMLNRLLISTISAVAEGLYLWIIGVEFAYIWGLIVFFLNFIPNIGSILMVVGASAWAFFQMGWTGGLLALVGLTAIDQIIGNFIDPRLQGRTLSLSPPVVLMVLLFWTWAWGIPGALLAVPMTVAIMAICAHIKPLEPVAAMLSQDGEVGHWR